MPEKSGYRRKTVRGKARQVARSFGAAARHDVDDRRADTRIVNPAFHARSEDIAAWRASRNEQQ